MHATLHHNRYRADELTVPVPGKENVQALYSLDYGASNAAHYALPRRMAEWIKSGEYPLVECQYELSIDEAPGVFEFVLNMAQVLARVLDGLPDVGKPPPFSVDADDAGIFLTCVTKSGYRLVVVPTNFERQDRVYLCVSEPEAR